VWDAILPAELLVLPAELGRSDVLRDDPVFFAPFARPFRCPHRPRRFPTSPGLLAGVGLLTRVVPRPAARPAM
jgi:hypothetical protein